MLLLVGQALSKQRYVLRSNNDLITLYFCPQILILPIFKILRAEMYIYFYV